MLSCYYAHSEEEYEYFQRRSYWLLEQDLKHMVFVHYLEAKGIIVILPWIFASLSWACADLDFGATGFMSVETTAGLASIQEALENSTFGELACSAQVMWQNSFEDCLSHNVPMNQIPISDLPNDQGGISFEVEPVHPNQETLLEPFCSFSDEQCNLRNIRIPLLDAEAGNTMNPFMTTENENYSFSMNDDFSMPSSSREDTGTLNPSIPQGQIFNIIDFSPNWAYADLETKVVVIGTFLKSRHELSNCRWSVMFGQVEVTAEILAEGVLCCQAPPHKIGHVTLCVTCSNGLACSEIREFEYRPKTHHMGDSDEHGDVAFVMDLQQRFETLLSHGPTASGASSVENDAEKQNILNAIISLIEENPQEENLISDQYAYTPNVIAQLFLEKRLKEKFYSWLVQGVIEDGARLRIFDKRGQGVLHLAAALGFNWALRPIVVSGTHINFRDADGWTALHWAAYYGREDTVSSLISMGAAPGLLTYPSAEYPSSRTPADLASFCGHKGISGFLAESSLTAQLSNLRMNVQPVEVVSERLALPLCEGDVPETLPLKDSLAAVTNATQTAAHIHQFYQHESFQRRQLVDDKLRIQEEVCVSRVSRRPISAVVRIQRKFRVWKGRKEFLLLRRRTIQIQAHFRGHLVRKCNPIRWCVSIWEKLMWWSYIEHELRGSVLIAAPKADDAFLQYEILLAGRKQTEKRVQKALERVNSMTRYPEAQAQYRRMLTAVKELRDA